VRSVTGCYKRDKLGVAVIQSVATHVLCDCEALAHLRFRHLGQFFMEPGDLYDVPIGKVLYFIRHVGLTKG
jgi:hypothetical protein